MDGIYLTYAGRERIPRSMSNLYSVQPTDCRTGFMVVDPYGRPVPHSIRRRRGPALELAAEMNGQLREQREHVEHFYAAQAREFIRRTT